MNNDAKAAELATNIRSLAKDIDRKCDALRQMGYTVYLGKNDGNHVLGLIVEKTTTVRL